MERQRVLQRAEQGRTVGLVALAIGLFASLPAVTWVGVGLVVASMAAITVVRVGRLREAPLSPTERTRLAGSWTLFVVAMSGFLVVAVPGDLPGGLDRLFWPLALTTVAAVLAYRRFFTAYVPEEEQTATADDEGSSSTAGGQ